MLFIWRCSHIATSLIVNVTDRLVIWRSILTWRCCANAYCSESVNVLNGTSMSITIIILSISIFTKVWALWPECVFRYSSSSRQSITYWRDVGVNLCIVWIDSKIHLTLPVGDVTLTFRIVRIDLYSPRRLAQTGSAPEWNDSGDNGSETATPLYLNHNRMQFQPISPRNETDSRCALHFSILKREVHLTSIVDRSCREFLFPGTRGGSNLRSRGVCLGHVLVYLFRSRVQHLRYVCRRMYNIGLSLWQLWNIVIMSVEWLKVHLLV